MPSNKTMRITGGTLVRRRFLTPPSVDEKIVRPTPDRVREAVFSMIKESLPGAYVLDIFAGSGGHGFEAISRGASYVCFVEKNPKIATTIKESIAMLGLESSCEIILSDAQKFINAPASKQANVIFLDPPYTLELDKEFFASVAKHLHENGTLIFRCHKKLEPKIGDEWSIVRDRIYGNTRVFIITLASHN